MKNNHRLPHAATQFFLLTVLVALFSWIGSIYGQGEVQSLLSPEGIRWMLRHALANYVSSPALGIVLMLFLGFGIAHRSGVWDTLGRAVKRSRSLSRKEKRALTLAVGTLLVYVLSVVCATFAPWTILRSITGTLANSPFLIGIWYIFSFGIGLSGIVFGYVSDRFRSDKAIVSGMSSLIARYADYFVTLFFAVQFFSALTYTHLPEWMGIGSQTMLYLYHICCFLPLVYLFVRKKNQEH